MICRENQSGKGGGVKLAKSPEEAKQIASEMLGMMLVTHQTGPEGREVKTLLIEEGLPIDKEFYLGITLDRVTGRNTFMASSAGGMDIEKVAEETPELILKESIDPSVGLRPFQARKLAFGLGIPNDLVNQAAKFMLSLYDAFTLTPILFLEDLGFCPKGEGGRFVANGAIAPGGRLAVNTSGGGLSYCHPGMYGLLVMIEAVRQIRGECGRRQVARCEVALAHGNGGVLSSQCTVVFGGASTV